MHVKYLFDHKMEYAIYCYGAGDRFRVLHTLLSSIFEIQGVIDAEENKWGKIWDDKIVCKSINELRNVKNPVVIVTVDSHGAYDEIELRLKQIGITTVFHVGEIIKEYRLRNNSLLFNNMESQYNCADECITQEIKVIDKSDITFVVSGKLIYDNGIPADRSIKSIRQFFPESKLILSTWLGEDTDPVWQYCDEIVLNHEPESKFNIFISGHTPQKLNNVNKQQFAMSEGMKKVKTKYAVRFRTDFELMNDSFLDFYVTWNNICCKREKKYHTFDGKILSVNTFIQNPDVYANGHSYMLSDCFLFGKTTDMMELWDGYQVSDEIMNYFDKNPNTAYENYEDFNYKYIAEQIFLLHVIEKKHINLKIPAYYGDSSDEKIIEDYERFIASNIVIGNHDELGIHSRFDDLYDYIFYTHTDSIFFYLKYIDNNSSQCRKYLENYLGKYEI